MTSRTPPPTYSEAVMWYMESGQQKVSTTSQNHYSQTSLTDRTSDIITMTSSKFAHSSPQLLTLYPSNSKQFDLRLTVPSSQLFDHPTETNNLASSSSTPAIIVHNTISIPADDEVESHFEKFYPKTDNVPGIKLHDVYENKFEQTITSHQNCFPKEDEEDETSFIDQELLEPLQEVNLTYHNIESTHSSVLQESSHSQCAFIRSNLESRNASDSVVEMIKHVKTNVVYTDSNTSGLHNSRRVSKDGQTQPGFHSHESLIRQNDSQNMSKANGKRNSMDEAWCESSVAVRKANNLSGPQGIVRQRSGTLDETSLSSTLAFKKGHGHVCIQNVLASTANTISKSSNDVSSRHFVGGQRDNQCSRGFCKCIHGPYSNGRVDCRHVVAPNNRTPPNFSSSHIHYSAEDPRMNKHHLLPETRSLQGTRGMRSASVDDVRMHNVADDYVWRDGKVQLKNGGMSHAESVRYVWKDGHVEKITSDANNEDTQVEILDASDSKACSRINPVFVCVLLLAIIALVIILPVYFTS